MKSYLTKIRASENIVLKVKDIPEEEKIIIEEKEVEETHPIVGLLQIALLGEYQQWDLYTSYASRLKGESRNAISDEFKAHAEEELGHIEMLQRYIVSMGEIPTTHRRPVLDMPKDATVQDIVEMQLSFEKDAVALYQKILNLLDDDRMPLSVDLEAIMALEMEHVHDLELLLESKPEVMAGLMFIHEEPGEATKPQAGYGAGCKCGCAGCKCGYMDKINNHWCMLALKELTPDVYARWQQGQKMTDAEKAYVLKTFSLKSILQDNRAINRFVESM